MAGTVSATVTGTIGDGRALTATVFTNIATFEFNAVTSMLKLVDVNDKVIEISIAAATTVTCTLSGAGGNYTLTVS